MQEDTARDVQQIIIHSGHLRVNSQYRPGSPLIVMSHGFGVERTSMGMFTDIADSLPDGFGYILFDYYKIDGTGWHVPGIQDMVNILSDVIHFAKKHTSDVKTISHSQGCTITALAKLDVNTHIFLAPPTRKIVSSWKERFVAKRKDRAFIDSNGDVVLTRKSDGKVLHISAKWFEELVGNTSLDEMTTLATQGKLSIVEAKGDKDIKDHRGYKSLHKNGATLITLEGNHNFDTPDRQTLIETVLDLLEYK